MNAPYARLLDAVFHAGPVFRMGFDRHVRAWATHAGRTAFIKFHNSPDFRAAYHARGGTYLQNRSV